MRLADHSGGTAADFNGLSFSPLFKQGTTGTLVVEKSATHGKVAPAVRRCQWAKLRGVSIPGEFRRRINFL
jgi:hypothetical protein